MLRPVTPTRRETSPAGSRGSLHRLEILRPDQDLRVPCAHERVAREVRRHLLELRHSSPPRDAGGLGSGNEDDALHRVRGTPRNIDHIVVAPAGVFVVDAKHYEGRIEVRNRGWFFRPDHRLYVGGRDKSQLARDMAWQVEAVESALRAVGVDPMPPITPVLCFVDGDWPLISPPDEFEGVRLESERSITKLVLRSHELHAAVIERLTAILAAALPPK